jgi:hypothetical protein
MLDASPARRLEITPGRHTVRVRSVASSHFDVRTGSRAGLILVSNPVTIDVPALSPAAEREALVRQTSAGGGAGLVAARTLVEKYPDAALEAVAASIAATPDAVSRSEYVRVAGTLGGDAPVPFLQSQLLPDAGLLSQVAAADALVARGRSDWQPALLGAWRRVRPGVPPTFPDQQGAGALIAFLARSGSAEAIDALADDAGAPVDVRLAVVRAFLPPRARPLTESSKGPNLGTMITSGLAALPDGPAGAAIGRLLDRALDDRAERPGLTATFEGGLAYVDPRVCDMAAFVFATRWPAQYRFTWPTAIAARDAEIDAIRKARGR